MILQKKKKKDKRNILKKKEQNNFDYFLQASFSRNSLAADDDREKNSVEKYI